VITGGSGKVREAVAQAKGPQDGGVCAHAHGGIASLDPVQRGSRDKGTFSQYGCWNSSPQTRSTKMLADSLQRSTHGARHVGAGMEHGANVSYKRRYSQ